MAASFHLGDSHCLWPWLLSTGTVLVWKREPSERHRIHVFISSSPSAPWNWLLPTPLLENALIIQKLSEYLLVHFFSTPQHWLILMPTLSMFYNLLSLGFQWQPSLVYVLKKCLHSLRKHLNYQYMTIFKLQHDKCLPEYDICLDT